ncbi:MAG: ribbon-helix-helix domain-containing protein [Nitrosospira sp.]
MTARTLKHDTEHESVKISFLTGKANRDALDTIAIALDRDRSYILNEAIAAYLEVHQWHLQDTLKAIEEADTGDFASDREVQQVFAKYKRDAC